MKMAHNLLASKLKKCLGVGLLMLSTSLNRDKTKRADNAQSRLTSKIHNAFYR